MNRTYKGWEITFVGNGYRLTRMKSLNGEILTATADTLTRSRIIITNKEAEIQWKHRDNTAT